MRLFWPAAGVLLLAMGAAQIISVRQETQTWDEGIHLAAGFRYWKTGDLHFNKEHPPLGKYLNALPLLFMQVQLPVRDASWNFDDMLDYSEHFLYHNQTGADRMLFAARLVTVSLTLLFGCCLTWWARRNFGPGVALFALALFAFDPNLIAHGRYVTSDLLVAFTIFLFCAMWSEYLRHGYAMWLVLSGIAMGLALGSKFSAVILIPIFLALYVLNWRGIRPLLVVSAIAILVIVVLYAPEARSFVPGIRLLDHSIEPARRGIDAQSTFGHALAKVSTWLGLGRNAFFEGLSALASKNRLGHDAYLLGMRSMTGWWYYFPIVFLVKSPLGLLLAVAAACSIAIRSPKLRAAVRTGIAWQVLVLAPVIFFAACISSRINIGVRHLLPIYPFLCILVAATLWRGDLKWSRVVLAVATALVVIESCLIFPYYLAFFNVASGGPSHGPRYLVDSNIDWGQDLRRLKTYLDRHGESGACLDYFGLAVPGYYGVRSKGEPRQGRDCMIAVSATLLMGMYVHDDPYAWLRQIRPIEKIGYSIYIYDLRSKER